MAQTQTLHEILSPLEVVEALTAFALKKRAIEHDPPSGASSVAIRIVKGETFASVHIREVPGDDKE